MEEHTPVLIVGGGLVGLSAAAFLSWHGVPTMVVERRSGTLLHPRARAVNPRTVELLRGIGLERPVLAAASRAYDEHAQIIHAESLAAPERKRTPMAPPRSADGTTGVSPCPWAPIDQDRLETLLRAHAEELGAQVRFSTALRSLEPTGDGGAIAKIEGDRGVGTVHADHVIAADGHRSPLRRHLGIGVTGPGSLGGSVNFVFSADLDRALRGRNVGVGHFDLPRPGTVLLPHDGRGRWVLGVPFDPGAGEGLSDFTRERCAEMARAAIGLPDAEITVLPQLADGTNVLLYEVEAKVAERFREGPVHLVGDAAHVMPPTGAFGASTGIQDAHNLAWKLAAVLKGRAGPDLLDTYDAERRPVAWFTMEQALLQTRDRTGRAVPIDADRTAADYNSVVFGYSYRSTAVIPEEGDADAPFAVPPERLTGRPGTRAPHMEIERGGRRMSILDLFGRRPVLLAGPRGDALAAAMRRVADRWGIDVDAVVVGVDVGDPGNRFTRAYGLGPGGAVLVRPDGFVAWRARDAVQDPAGVLDGVLRRTLSLTG